MQKNCMLCTARQHTSVGSLWPWGCWFATLSSKVLFFANEKSNGLLMDSQTGLDLRSRFSYQDRQPLVLHAAAPLLRSGSPQVQSGRTHYRMLAFPMITWTPLSSEPPSQSHTTAHDTEEILFQMSRHGTWPQTAFGSTVKAMGPPGPLLTNISPLSG